MSKGLGSLLGLAVGVGVMSEVIFPALGSMKKQIEGTNTKEKYRKKMITKRNKGMHSMNMSVEEIERMAMGS